MSAMISTFVDAMEIYRSFTQPTIYDSIRLVLKHFDLQNSMNIYFRGESEITKLVGADFGSNPADSLYTNGTFRNKVYVDATVNPSPFNAGYHNQGRSRTEAYFWLDALMKLGISPVFEGRQVVVEVITHFTSRQKAQEFVNRINNIRSRDLTLFTFSPTAHLPVNDGIIELFKNIHDLLIKNKLRTDGFMDYLTEMQAQPFTIISNLAGNYKTLAFPIMVRDVVVEFEDPEIRLPQKAEIFGQYEVGFSYTFFHNEFTGWNIDYPLSIHQDQIDDKWIPNKGERYDTSNPYVTSANPEYVAGAAFTDNDRSTQAPFYLSLPAHDSWESPNFYNAFPIIKVQLSIEDLPGEQLLCNIFDIPRFVWNDNAKNYIIRRKDFAFKFHSTPFIFEVYASDLQVLPEQLRLDELGNVYITRQATMGRMHHLLISIDYDIANYDLGFWDDLRNNPGDKDIIPGIYPWFPWDNLPDDWQDDAPWNLPVDVPRRWNNYEMYLGLCAGNITQMPKGY